MINSLHFNFGSISYPIIHFLARSKTTKGQSPPNLHREHPRLFGPLKCVKGCFFLHVCERETDRAVFRRRFNRVF